MTTRTDILDQALAAVSVDRNAIHGAPEDTFQRIAGLWSSYVGATLDATDVAAMMILFKVARIAGNPSHLDSWVDIAGYAACGGEVARESHPHSGGE